MFTFGFELDRGNIARTRVFPPFMWRVVDYLTGQLRSLPPDQLVARTPAALDVSETNFSLTSERWTSCGLIAALITRNATRQVARRCGWSSRRSHSLLTASPDRTVMVDGLAPGRYVLQKSRAADEKGMVMMRRPATSRFNPTRGPETCQPASSAAEVASLLPRPARQSPASGRAAALVPPSIVKEMPTNLGGRPAGNSGRFSLSA